MPRVSFSLSEERRGCHVHQDGEAAADQDPRGDLSEAVADHLRELPRLHLRVQRHKLLQDPGMVLDGPAEAHDRYRLNRAGHGTWKRVIESVELLKRERVDFNVLCVVSQANVQKAAETYKFFRSLAVDYIQYIPLSEFDGLGQPLPFTITAEQYGRFLCETFDLWWPDRSQVRIRYFDNIAEALAGQKPGNCTLHETCDSYAVVEYNGDVYPCDFFVEKDWKLGNIHLDSWPEIARRQRRYQFAAKKTLAHPECQVCEYSSICHGGCPKHRHDPRRQFEDLDYFCAAYKMIFRKAVEPLKKEVRRITSQAPHTR